MKKEKYICPVCGYKGLDEPAYDETYLEGSYDICSCCGCEFGFDDFDFKLLTFQTAQNKWLSEGAMWFNKNEKPKNWNLEDQLKNLKLPEIKQLETRLKIKFGKINYKAIFNIVRKELNKVDPIGVVTSEEDVDEVYPTLEDKHFFEETIANEYDMENIEIIPLINKYTDYKEFANKICEIFIESTEMKLCPEQFYECAKNILEKTKNL